MDESSGLIKTLSTFTEDDICRIYNQVFATESGKLVLQDLRNRGYYNAPTINFLGGNDPISVGYREGMRGMVLHIETSMKKPEEKHVEND